MLTPEKRVAVEGGLRRGNLALGPPESRAFTASGGILRVLPQVPDMEPSYDRRSFVAWLGSLPLVGRYLSPLPAAPPPVTIDATPTPLYQQPDGRRNLVRITVTGLEAPAARARVTDRRGALVRPAGAVLRREPLASGGRGAGPGDPRGQGRVRSAVRERADGDSRPRDVRARRLARRHVRARARARLLERANHRRARAAPHVPDRARGQRRALPGERLEPGAGGAAPSRGGSDARRAHRRVDDLPAALLVGGARRQPGAALARVPLRRRPALRIRRRRRGDGAALVRLAAHEPGARLAGLPLRCRLVVRRAVGQRRHGRAAGGELRGVPAAVRLPAYRRGPAGRLLSRRGTAVRVEAAGAARRHGAQIGRAHV